MGDLKTASARTAATCATAALTGVLLTLGAVSPAVAMEDTGVFMPGISVGTPTGALPPPGVYLNTGVQYFDLKAVNGSGDKVGVKLHDYNAHAQALWVPEMAPILGATYGAYIVQPIRALTVKTAGGTFDNNGWENTIISPINLSWNLKNGFFVSAGFAYYHTAMGYSASDAVHVNRNYSSYEPNLSVSYLADGWHATVHAAFDFNTTNDSNKYRSGNAVTFDYTLQHRLGAFDVGVGGSYLAQYTDDTIDGRSVPASPANSKGSRTTLVNVGPAINYHVGSVTLSSAVLFDVYGRNTAPGVRSFFSVSVPLWTPEKKTPAS